MRTEEKGQKCSWSPWLSYGERCFPFVYGARVLTALEAHAQRDETFIIFSVERGEKRKNKSRPQSATK